MIIATIGTVLIALCIAIIFFGIRGMVRPTSLQVRNYVPSKMIIGFVMLLLPLLPLLIGIVLVAAGTKDKKAVSIADQPIGKTVVSSLDTPNSNPSTTSESSSGGEGNGENELVGKPCQIDFMASALRTKQNKNQRQGYKTSSCLPSKRLLKELLGSDIEYEDLDGFLETFGELCTVYNFSESKSVYCRDNKIVSVDLGWSGEEDAFVPSILKKYGNQFKKIDLLCCPRSIDRGSV